jgi:starvation-inducible DNA-binding protein
MADTKPNLGLTEEERGGVVDLFSKQLADHYALYTKTRKFHWNVVGHQFHDLHLLFEKQYTELETNIDDIAEYIRQVGAKTPGTLKEFCGLTRIEEHPGVNPPSNTMVKILADDHELIIRQLRKDIDATQDEFHDAAAADFLTGLMEEHMKTAWMLRSLIEDSK